MWRGEGGIYLLEGGCVFIVGCGRLGGGMMLTEFGALPSDPSSTSQIEMVGHIHCSLNLNTTEYLSTISHPPSRW